MRDLDVEGEPNGAPPAGRAWSVARSVGHGCAAPAPARRSAAAPERDPAADLTPEDLVLKDEPKPREKSRRRPASQQTPREVALMGLLGWVIMGLAIWHFTIFMPDRFWGGIVGAFVGSLIGAVVVGLIIYGVKVSALRDPRRKGDGHRRSCSTRCPGALIGIAVIYLEGMRRERAGTTPQLPE